MSVACNGGSLFIFKTMKQTKQPNSMEAEEVVIASCLLSEDGSCYDEVSQIVQPTDFYSVRNKAIFSAIGKIVRDGQLCSEITLADYLEKDGSLEEVGGLQAIFQIQQRVETEVHAKYSAKIVREKSKLRRIIRHSRASVERAERGEDPDEIIGSLDSNIVSICDERESEFDLSSCIDRAVEQLTTVSDELIIPSGLASFDAEMADGGMKAGQMHTIGARPGRGKTTMALNIAGRTCTTGNGVGVISLEMSDVELVKKLVCMKAQVNFDKFKDNLHTQEEQDKVDAAVGVAKGWNLHIDDNPYMSADDI